MLVGNTCINHCSAGVVVLLSLSSVLMDHCTIKVFKRKDKTRSHIDQLIYCGHMLEKKLNPAFPQKTLAQELLIRVCGDFTEQTIQHARMWLGIWKKKASLYLERVLGVYSRQRKGYQ